MWHFFVSMAIERNSGDATPMSHGLIDVPVVEGGIGGDMGRELVRGKDGVLEERAVMRHVGFIEGQGVLGEHHIAVDGIGGRRHAGVIAPQVFLFLGGGPIRLFLVGRALDAQPAIGIAGQALRFVVAVFDIDRSLFSLTQA